MVLAGLIILVLSMGSIGGRMEWLWMQSFVMLRDWAGPG
jgi:flagellar biosynthetic protein FliR